MYTVQTSYEAPSLWIRVKRPSGKPGWSGQEAGPTRTSGRRPTLGVTEAREHLLGGAVDGADQGHVVQEVLDPVQQAAQRPLREEQPARKTISSVVRKPNPGIGRPEATRPRAGPPVQEAEQPTQRLHGEDDGDQGSAAGHELVAQDTADPPPATIERSMTLLDPVTHCEVHRHKANTRAMDRHSVSRRPVQGEALDGGGPDFLGAVAPHPVEDGRALEPQQQGIGPGSHGASGTWNR